MVGHVGVDPLMAGGGDRVARGQRPAEETALQRLGRSLQPDIVLSPGRTRRVVAGFDVALRTSTKSPDSDPGIGALQAVEADDVEPCVVVIGADGARRGRALADDLDHVAFGQPELGHQSPAAAGQCRGRRRPGSGSPPAGAGRGFRHPPSSSSCRLNSRHAHSHAECMARTEASARGSIWNPRRRKKRAGRCRPA